MVADIRQQDTGKETAMPCRDNYPLDLDAGLNYTRYPGEVSIHPYPGMIGALPTIHQLFDAPVVVSQRYPIGYGPAINVLSTRQSPNFGQITFPETPKVIG